MFSQVHDIVGRLCEVYGEMSLDSCCCYKFSDKQTRWTDEKSQISFLFKMVICLYRNCCLLVCLFLESS